ncbi:DUF1616 family protein [Natrialba magadii ATCC 43099]|uniref:DUF1616 family protein n=1 Tax=Natrialba magadii (strain ATCC 43099 / DSM 3394 / CCM 3739 / CIP 104546 / IAM 13178 / JCM 8861 / NBRC 102185 / NCIMB 2190 / MS3) TaxID=547559 RepID=D3SR05_NATMM|nr:DUF1616 domain-containing protein [Natrialba magadii]ADD06561.1 DUF1616 family protein [Natrialba magadii ATCC 43099]ELY31978.1 hypothetical protein C500_05353 [Natrialba magadii ATCC 43099]
MSLRTDTQTRLGTVRQYPGDLAVVSLLAIFTYLVVTSLGEGSAFRLLATLPLVLFLPGYALVATLFPARERVAQETTATAIDVETYPRGIDLAERLGLAFALSLAVVPVVALVLAVTEWGLATDPIAATLAVVTVFLAQLGAIRRLRVPESKRFSVAPLAALSRSQREDTTAGTLSSIILGVAIVAAVGALLVGLIAPLSAGGFTQLALYSEGDGGELVAGELEDEVEPGESVPATIEIENQEGEDVTYTVVVQQQVLENGAVMDRAALETRTVSVADDEAVVEEFNVAPAAEPGETVRIAVLLYEEEPSGVPTAEDAVADTNFWVTVTEPDAEVEE